MPDSSRRGFRLHLSRMEVDRSGWQHPRPPSDPRLIMLAIGFAYVSFVQTFFARPESSVAAKAYTGPAAIAVALLLVLASALLLRAAFCRSQFSSWGWELLACVGYVGQAAIQFVALVSVNDQWWGTSTVVWTVFWGVGNAIRAGILVRRVW